MYRLLRKYHCARQLPLRDLLVVAEVNLIRLAVDVLVLLFPYRIWRKLLLTGMAAQPCNALSESELARLTKLFTLGSNNYPLPANCLRNALAVHLAFRRRGHITAVSIGVTKDGHEMAAHAWTRHARDAERDLELSGRVFHPLRRI